MPKTGDITVKEVMRKRFPKVKSGDSLKSVIKKFYRHNVSILPVFSGRTFAGEIRKMNLLKLIIDVDKIPQEEIIEMGYSVDMGFFAKKAKDLMEKHAVFVREDDTVKDVAWRMLRNSVRSCPVVRKNKLVGIVMVDDIMGRILKEMKR
ncbi:CBS domain-containing protein [Candidatus Woesearchaeota archaeon]|nr:CBS domain-containing protein [Candidatus Woesearchaeota archaeon]